LKLKRRTVADISFLNYRRSATFAREYLAYIFSYISFSAFKLILDKYECKIHKYKLFFLLRMHRPIEEKRYVVKCSLIETQ